MPMLGPVAIQTQNGTFSWCCIELNAQSEVQAVLLAPTTGEGMMPTLDEYTTLTDANIPKPLRVLKDPSAPFRIEHYCFFIENKQLFRCYSQQLHGAKQLHGERVLTPDQFERIGGKALKHLQKHVDEAFIVGEQTAALDEIKSALQRQYDDKDQYDKDQYDKNQYDKNQYDKNQLRVDFLTADMPPNTRPLNANQRTACKNSAFYHDWLALKKESQSSTDYCSSLMGVLNHNDTVDWIHDDKQKQVREEGIRFLRMALWPENISALDAFYADESRPSDDVPRLGDVHAFMVQLLIQELTSYDPKPFQGRKPTLTPLQYDFRIGDYSTNNAETTAERYNNDNQSQATLISQALDNPGIEDDPAHMIKRLSDLQNSLRDDVPGIRAPFQHYRNKCVINQLRTTRGVTPDALFQELDTLKNTLQQHLTLRLNADFNPEINQIKANHPNKTVWHALRERMTPQLLMSHDLGPLIIAQLDRLDAASISRWPSSYWGTPTKVEAAVRALHNTLSETPEGQDPTPYLYRSLFNKDNGQLYQAFSSHRMPFFTHAGDPTRAILNMSLDYARRRLAPLAGTPLGDSLLLQMSRMERATHQYWPWCYNSQKKLNAILDAIIRLQPEATHIETQVLAHAIQHNSELKTALNMHRFFQSASPTATLNAIETAIAAHPVA